MSCKNWKVPNKYHIQGYDNAMKQAFSKGICHKNWNQLTEVERKFVKQAIIDDVIHENPEQMREMRTELKKKQNKNTENA
jgi:hypothetical protein